MRKLLISLFASAALLGAAPAHADMAQAQQAYADGRFLQALELWRAEADAGNADAAWYAGNIYIDGLGLNEPNAPMAAAMYRLSSDLGSVEGTTSLGLLYEQGLGVEQDYIQATQLLYDAAVAGHPVAQVELANLFLTGVEGQVEQSQGHAFEWYGLAANRQVVFALMRFGQMNFYGVGAPVNQEAGLMWLSIAREIIASGEEPYWSYRAYPLDSRIGAEGGSLRDAVEEVYQDMLLEADPAMVDTAHDAALAWMAERTPN